MSPSTTVRRAGVVTASALALSLGGAFTAGSATALTTCPLGQILSSTGQCVKQTVGSVTQPTTSPTSGGTSSSGGGINVPLPTLPVPTSGTSGGSSSGSGSTSGGSSGGGLQLPRLPVVSDLPDVGGQTGGSSGGGLGGIGGAISEPTVPGTKGTSTATSDGSSVPGSKPGAAGSGGMLGPASAYLPTSGILGFANFGGSGTATIATSASNLKAIPSPLLANQPASQLAAVQAPLLAAGEDAGRGGTVLAAFGGYALPGLLVVLATAVVATVGAGNIRVWQARLAARRAAY